MGILTALRPKARERNSRAVEMLNLDSMALLFEERVKRATHGIADRTKRRRADRRLRKAITERLEAIVIEIAANEKPELILEIGAHGAEFSKAAKVASPLSRCIAFEGNPRVHERFSADLQASSVEYEQICLSDRNTELTFHVPVWKEASMDNMGSVLQYQENLDSESPNHEAVKVKAIPLDGFLNGSAGRSKLMWIDVEGAIGSVLAGAKKSLSNCIALYMEVETEPHWEGQLILDRHVYDILAPLGFIPVLRDVQRERWQYNVLYVHESIANRPYLLSAARAYLDPPPVPAPAVPS